MLVIFNKMHCSPIYSDLFKIQDVEIFQKVMNNGTDEHTWK